MKLRLDFYEIIVAFYNLSCFEKIRARQNVYFGGYYKCLAYLPRFVLTVPKAKMKSNVCTNWNYKYNDQCKDIAVSSKI